jgi:hypothetical protein
MTTKSTRSAAPLMRAKFICTTVVGNDTSAADNHYEDIHMAPVVGDGSTENESFSRYTPSGSLQFRVTNPDLFGKIKPNDQFYLDFTPVAKED